MSPIIRASDHHADIQGVAFNLEDLTARAHGYLDEVRAQAARLVADARREAASQQKKLEDEARARGQAAAQREAAERAQQQLQQQLATLLPALKQLVADLQQAKLAWLKHWETSAVHLAAAIAARVIRREVAQRPEIAVDLVREALELAAGSAQVRISLHPADCEALGGQVRTLVAELAGLAAAEIVADPTVPRGSCRLDTQYGTIDQRFESQLQRIEEELT